jgi:hypothetical protein
MLGGIEIERIHKEDLQVHRNLLLLALSGLLMIFLAGAAVAQHQHDHGATPKAAAKPPEKSAEKERIQSVTVEGLKVSLEVMDMSAHMGMPGMKASPQHGDGRTQSHALMVTLQDTASKEIISDAQVSFSILGPSGKKENGKMEWSGDHYGAGFNPQEKGAYQVQLKIESGGMDREAKLSYEFK